MSQLYDRLNNPVPGSGHVHTAFADAEIVDECIKGILAYASVLDRISHTRKRSVSDYCDRIIDALPKIASYLDDITEAFPFAVCEACHGVKPGGCTSCGYRGYLNRHEWQLHESEKQVGKRDELGRRKSMIQVMKKLVRLARHGEAT